MTENDQAWQNNTPQTRAQRRANWGQAWGKEGADTTPPGRKPEGSYGQAKHRWT
jgi:hypothetical protein